MLITEEYRQQNQKMHENPAYGTSAHIWASRINDICRALKTHDVLDYGCGKRHLEKGLGWPIANYDPCIPGLDTPPEPHAVVACLDVLEHIEPKCLDAVLDDLKRVTGRCGFFLIANRPARKTLPDGRNAHLIQEDETFWLPRLISRWRINLFHEVGHDGRVTGYAAIVFNKGG